MGKNKNKKKDKVCRACSPQHEVKQGETIGQCGGVVGPAKTPCMTNSCMMGRVYNHGPRARPVWLCLRCAEHVGWPTDDRVNGGEEASEEASQGGAQPAHNTQQKKQGKKKKNGGSPTAQYTDSAQRANLSSSVQTWLTASSQPALCSSMQTWLTASSRQPGATEQRQCWYEHEWEGAHAWSSYYRWGLVRHAPGEWHAEHQWNGSDF